jgi:O-antigen/teichoic acid export membrane protein
MRSNKKTILVTGSFNLFSNILLRSISILTVPIFTRLMSPTDFGIVSNFSAIYTILSVILSLSLSSSVGVAYFKKDININEFISSIIVLYSFVVLLFFIFTFVFAKDIIKEFNFTPSLIFFLSISLICSPALDIKLELLKFSYDYKKLLWVSLFVTVFGLCISLFLVKLMPNEKYFARILGIYLPSCILGFLIFLTVIRKFNPAVFFGHCKYALRISLPMIPHSLGMIVFTQIDRILISKYDGLDSAGIYSFGLTYALLVQIIANSIMSAFTPWLYDAYINKKFREIEFYSKKIFIYFALLVFGVITFSYEIIMFLGSFKFIASREVVFSLGISTFFQFVYGFFAAMEIYKERTKYLALGTVFVSIFSFGLNFYFIPIYGFIICGVISLFSYLLLSIVHGVIVNKILKKDIFGTFTILIISIILLLFSYISFYFIDSLLMRIIFYISVIIYFIWKDRLFLVAGLNSIRV